MSWERSEPGRVPAGVLAVLVHVLFLALIIFGVTWHVHEPAPVQVALWKDLPAPQAAKPAPRMPEVRRQASKPIAAPPRPSALAAEKIQADIALKREKKRRALEIRKAERQALAIEQAKEKAQREAAKREEQAALAAREKARQRKREDAARAAQQKARKLEREQAARAQALARLNRQRTLALQAQLAAAQQAARQQMLRADEERFARAQAIASTQGFDSRLIARYTARIRAKILRFIILPPNLSGDPSAEFSVTLMPNGQVAAHSLVRGSGNAAYDAAVERAILMAQPLPLPPDPALFDAKFRELDLRFRAKDSGG
ncbi:MAG: cell envelope integrity protein TolA [Betaproteobacteria bacterium]|nr:cell envelope integrity protein TolA [Betaproteobacteria bacterium]